MAIERKFIQQNLREFQIKEHIFTSLGKVGVAGVKLQRTPLGEKILVSCSRPGLVVGRGGSSIQKLTIELKERFGLENPQIEIAELGNPMIEPEILAEMISNSLERFGAGRFKGVGHKAMSEAMRSGALGVEILISGKIPSSRAKTWRFYNGYLKKCGDVAVEGVNIAYRIAKLKTGVVGIKVSVMPPTTILPDRIDLIEDAPVLEDVTSHPAVAELEDAVTAGVEDAGAPAAKKAAKKAPAKKSARKSPAKKAVKKADEPAQEPAADKAADAPADETPAKEQAE